MDRGSWVVGRFSRRIVIVNLHFFGGMVVSIDIRTVGYRTVRDHLDLLLLLPLPLPVPLRE